MKDRERTIKIVLSVVGLGLAVYVIVPYLKRSPGPLTSIPFVCVATGEIVVLTPDEAGMIPARNRRTGERTLVPCVRNEDGTYRIAESYQRLIEGRLKDVNRFVDPATMQVRPGPQG